MIYLIIGEKNSGKTKYLKELIKTSKNTDGFLTIKQFEKKDFVGYNIERVLTGERVPFIRLDKTKIKESNILLEYNKMIFLKEGFNFARRIFFEAVKQGYDNFIIDEVGHLELEGKVFNQILSESINLFKNLYITVRSDIVENVIKKYKIKEFEKIYIERREDDRPCSKERKPFKDSKKVQGERDSDSNNKRTEESRVNQKGSKRRVKKDRTMGNTPEESIQDNMEE